MKHLNQWWPSLSTLFVLVQLVCLASSHREAPILCTRPQSADCDDWYAFVSL